PAAPGARTRRGAFRDRAPVPLGGALLRRALPEQSARDRDGGALGDAPAAAPAGGRGEAAAQAAARARAAGEEARHRAAREAQAQAEACAQARPRYRHTTSPTGRALDKE